MVTFDASQPGTSAREWDATIENATPLDLSRFDRLIVVAAHPDDESLGAGGLIAQFTDRSAPVQVIVITDGRESHPASGTHRPSDLARIRALELRSALPDSVDLVLLRHPDGAARENSAQIETDVASLIDGTPASTLVVGPWRGDGHRDHRVVGEIVSRAASGRTLLEYPIWFWHWGSPDEAPPLARLAVDADRKERAIRSHTSQVDGLGSDPGDGPMLRADFVEHFLRDQEVFIASSLPAAYFDDLYERRADPWRLESRWYEERKRDLTIAALPRRRFSKALELGCSIGMLTQRLEQRADSVLAVDVSQAALDATAARTGDGVTVLKADLAVGLPDGEFDLVVLSEVGYYLSPGVLAQRAAEIGVRLAPDGVVVTCHWRHPVAGYLQCGDEVQAVLCSALGLTKTVRHEERDFVLEVFSRDPRSVGEREGLA